MKQANKDFLEQHRGCYVEVVHAQTAQRASKIEGDLLRIIRDEFFPNYVHQPEGAGCGNCIFNLVKILYSNYDNWLLTQPKPVVVAASFPVNDPPAAQTAETKEQLKARLADPNRVIKRRAKRK